MPICCVKDSGLCPKCLQLGLPTAIGGNFTTDGSPTRILELSDLCRPCVRKLKTSYIEVVNPKRRDILDKIRAKSPWCKRNPFVGRSDENESL